VVFIEFWRGVPIITVIFLASILLPLIMPIGLQRRSPDACHHRARFRDRGLHGGSRARRPAGAAEGQAEAAQALGLGYWRIQQKIVLPQALRIALPAMTNDSSRCFKNTTLVLIVSLFDLLASPRRRSPIRPGSA